MPDEQNPIQPDGQPPPLPRPSSVRPERSRMIPPVTESEEWQNILDNSRKSRVRKGVLRKTATVDGATLVQHADMHAKEAFRNNASELLSKSQQLPLPCPACGSPRSPGAKFCVACGMPFEESSPACTTTNPATPTAGASSTDQAIAHKEAATISSTTFHCQNCGSDIAIPKGELSIRCPFCDSTYVAEIQADRTDRRRPEFVIGFAVTREQALQKYFEWIRQGGWFRPGDLSLRAISDKQMGVYVPFWHYACEARSRWNAMIGQYWYRTETYTVRTQDGKTETHTRTVQETEWSPLSGNHHKYYFGYLVSASKGLSQQEALSVQPYDLRAVTRFKPFYLAGWISEEYSIDYSQAKSIAESEFQQRESNNISRMMPGDTYAQLNVQTAFELNETDLMLLPVHILSYRYRDRVYRFLVNGQTGRFSGEKPVSGARIAVAVTIVVLVILIAAFIIWYLQNR